jgi:hypothetical protein
MILQFVPSASSNTQAEFAQAEFVDIGQCAGNGSVRINLKLVLLSNGLITHITA